MEVTASINRKNLFIASVLNLSSQRSLWLLPSVLGLYIGNEARAASAFAGALLALAIFIGVFLLMALALFILGIAIGATLQALHPGPLPGVLGQHTYRIAPEGVFEATDVNAGQQAWSGISAIRASPFGVLLQLPNTSAHFIPRRAFASREHLMAFVTQARGFAAAARERSP